MLTPLAVKRCTEMDRKRTSRKNGFVRYDFKSRQGREVGDESVQVGERACTSGSSSMAVTLEAVPLFFRPDCKRADINSVRHDFYDYRRFTVNP